MKAITISSKYRVVIPHDIRKQFNLKPGQKVMFIPYNNGLHLVVVPSIKQARGMFKGIKTHVPREEVDEDPQGLESVRCVAKT